METKKEEQEKSRKKWRKKKRRRLHGVEGQALRRGGIDFTGTVNSGDKEK